MWESHTKELHMTKFPTKKKGKCINDLLVHNLKKTNQKKLKHTKKPRYKLLLKKTNNAHGPRWAKGLSGPRQPRVGGKRVNPQAGVRVRVRMGRPSQLCGPGCGGQAQP